MKRGQRWALNKPFWDDRNHPNKCGNERVARRIFEQLRPALARARAKAPAT